MGHLCVVHGYFTGAYACAQHAKVYRNCVFGHIHAIEAFCVPGLEHQEARSIGCMCDLNLQYMDAKPAKLKWSLGWGYGLLFPDGTYTIYQAREIGGKIVVATDFKMLK
jgi:hypothetical protein